MSTIPQIKPGTPLNQFYALGIYKNKNQSQSHTLNRQTIAKASNAATLNERNHYNQEEINIKPQIHSQFDVKEYKPYKYLKSLDEHKAITDNKDSKIINNQEVNRIYALKRQIYDRTNGIQTGSIQRQPTPVETPNQKRQNHGRNSSQIQFGNEDMHKMISRRSDMKSHRSNKSDFMNSDITPIQREKATTQINNYKNQQINLNMSKRGQSIIDKPANLKVTQELEKMLQDYKPKTMINSTRSKSIDRSIQIGAEKYQKSLPDFFRIMDNPDYNNVTLLEGDGKPQQMMQIISKTQGWMTVTPKNKNRKKPIEKLPKGNASKVNQLSPVWMQVDHQKPGPDPLRPNVIHQGVRQESNMTFLVEKKQPLRSVFNIGSFRHNVHSEKMRDTWQRKAVESGLTSEKPQRLIKWDEPKQNLEKYNREISPKIGSAHFK